MGEKYCLLYSLLLRIQIVLLKYTKLNYIESNYKCSLVFVNVKFEWKKKKIIARLASLLVIYFCHQICLYFTKHHQIQWEFCMSDYVLSVLGAMVTTLEENLWKQPKFSRIVVSLDSCNRYVLLIFYGMESTWNYIYFLN